jgi:RES domain
VADDVVTIGPPGTLWRVGRNPEPLTVVAPKANDLRSKRAGNRFDIAGVEVLYCASTLEGCFAETLARFRPKLELAALVADEWKAAGHLRPGSVPAGWRHRRTAVEVALDPGYRFLDVDDLDTHQVLRGELALGLAALGYGDLDVGLIRGPDRRVTRLVANWAHQQMADGDDDLYRFAGIRYMSRLSNDWVCWAIFPGVELEQRQALPVEREMPELVAVAARFGLRVF